MLLAVLLSGALTDALVVKNMAAVVTADPVAVLTETIACPTEVHALEIAGRQGPLQTCLLQFVQAHSTDGRAFEVCEVAPEIAAMVVHGAAWTRPDLILHETSSTHFQYCKLLVR